jgi:hypothetical protein
MKAARNISVVAQTSKSAVSQVCNLRAAETLKVLSGVDALPIGNRRYSRLEVCATF